MLEGDGGRVKEIRDVRMEFETVGKLESEPWGGGGGGLGLGLLRIVWLVSASSARIFDLRPRERQG